MSEIKCIYVKSSENTKRKCSNLKLCNKSTLMALFIDLMVLEKEDDST